MPGAPGWTGFSEQPQKKIRTMSRMMGMTVTLERTVWCEQFHMTGFREGIASLYHKIAFFTVTKAPEL
jgi:hypothetical protein